MIVVCDSSPIVALAILDNLDLLDKLFENVIIPKQVFLELTIPDKLAFKKIATWAEGKVQEAFDTHLIQAYNLLLDKGE